VRGLAHIGVVKALAEAGIRPAVIAGTSVGSIIGAGLAAGLDWSDLAEMARSVFWPSLLRAKYLERFCSVWLPARFSDLRLPFAAIATEIVSMTPVVLNDGHLAKAISASCAMRVIRRAVMFNGSPLKDGGMACVLPATQCREMGAEFVISSDVWELSSVLRGFGLSPRIGRGARVYPRHYRDAVGSSDILLTPSIPVSGYVPGAAAVERMIEAGESAVVSAMNHTSANLF